ncbi:MAG: glycosyltransferase, partial [Moraxellaceae bacterium]
LRTAKANFHIGLIGRLEPVKRADLFIQTAEIILRQYCVNHTWHFHIIGDGKLKDALRRQVQNLGLDEHITFHGHRNDIPSCILALNLVMMCSDHEGTPMTALETLALGTLLVAHNTGGLSELLESYPQLLVDSHTPEGYASAVVAACIKPDIACTQLDARYTANQNAANTLALYNQLLVGPTHE